MKANCNFSQKIVEAGMNPRHAAARRRGEFEIPSNRLQIRLRRKYRLLSGGGPVVAGVVAAQEHYADHCRTRSRLRHP